MSDENKMTHDEVKKMFEAEGFQLPPKLSLQEQAKKALPIVELLSNKNLLYLLARDNAWMLETVDNTKHEGSECGFGAFAAICRVFPAFEFDGDRKTHSVQLIGDEYCILQDTFGCLVFRPWNLKKIVYTGGAGTLFYFKDDNIANAAMNKEIYDMCLKNASLSLKCDKSSS